MAIAHDGIVSRRRAIVSQFGEHFNRFAHFARFTKGGVPVKREIMKLSFSAPSRRVRLLLGIPFFAADAIPAPAYPRLDHFSGVIPMPRLLPIFALTASLATAAPLIADGVTFPGSPLPSCRGFSIWAPVENVNDGESTIELQYAAPIQSQTSFLRVLLPAGTRELLLPNQWTTGAIHDLTGWRTSLSSFGEASHQAPLDRRFYENQRYYEDHLPIQRDRDRTQVFNIAIGAQY